MMSHKMIFFFFVLIGLSIQSCVSPRDRSIKEWEALEKQNQDWEVAKVDKKEKPTWIIYTRKIAGTNFLEYKIEGNIESTPKACLSSFKQDIHDLADQSSKKYPTYEIVEKSKESLLTYVIHKEPFPLKNTEMSVRYLFLSEADGSRAVQWTEAWDEHPIQPSKKLKRVQTFRGAWYFSPASDHSCKAVNSVQFDPQKMPMWLVEPMVFKFLKEGLQDIRERTEN
jgi:hypothetical protein